jgi:recombination protein RecA
MATKRQAGIILTDIELKKRYNSGLAADICLTSEDTLILPSSVLPLNYQMGGGIVYGKILELYGQESTGKSLMAKNLVASAQSLGGVGLWADAEGTFAPYWAEANGIDLTKLWLLPEENAVEVISDWCADMILTARSRLLNNEPIVLVLDSLAALECMENINMSQVDARAEMGNRAKAIYKFLRIRNKFFLKYGVCPIFINQLRQKVGASKFEDPDTTPGGGAMKFYASYRLGLYQGKQIKDDTYDEKVGQYVHIRAKKNKMAPPRPTIHSKVFFQEHEGMLGYHKYEGMPEILKRLGVLKNKGKMWYYKGEVVAKSEDKLLRKFIEDEDFRKKMIKKSGINTISKTRKQLEAIQHNLYPVSQNKKKKSGKEEEE